MKSILSLLILSLAFLFSNQVLAQDPIVVNKTDKTIYVQMSMDKDFTSFGYEKADKSSAKLICFSSMTADVDGNPHKCKMGAYYTSDDFTINYLGMEGNFVKAEAKANGVGSVFYLEKSAVAFED